MEAVGHRVGEKLGGERKGKVWNERKYSEFKHLALSVHASGTTKLIFWWRIQISRVAEKATLMDIPVAATILSNYQNET